MADKGPLLTSCIIFYLTVGAAIFKILEEPNLKSATSRYQRDKERILETYTCLTKKDLDYILEVMSEAAGQGVAVTGGKYVNNWDWPNSVIFASTIVTTIGYGNVAPKTVGGRVFCILYGLCGIPLCLVWISELGSFFGDRARRLSGVLILRGVSVKKVQFMCTAIFIFWGLMVHLVIPPFVFMSLEGWSYLEGLYFSFITLTTVGFGDYVAGVNPNIEYPKLYKAFAEIWMYMGLAWLSLFFSWNVHMVVEAHKVLKKRRHRHRGSQDEEPQAEECGASPAARPTVVDIFDFLSEEGEDYGTVIKEIGHLARAGTQSGQLSRSKSCSDLSATDIQILDHSPRQRRRVGISQVFAGAAAAAAEEEEALLLVQNAVPDPVTEMPRVKEFGESSAKGAFGGGPDQDELGEIVRRPGGGGTRFTISKVEDGDAIAETDEKG